MGSKGSNTTTQTQSYQANPAISGASQEALNMGLGAAHQPFQTPAAPVAPFANDQNAAFQNVRNIQGIAQPYFNAASDYTAASADPVTGQAISGYFNPMASYVGQNLAETFGNQMRQTTGQLTQAAGGVGASRIAVGQAELARQQGLAAGKTYADLYQPALAAAQADKQRQANAGYAFGAFGPANVAARLQETGGLLNTGGLQQQQQQAEMNAPYQQELARLAYPFQTAQFLSGITGQQSPVMGGTTTGTVTKPAPSLFSQIAGAGLTGLGLYRGFGGSFGGGKGSGGGGSPDIMGGYSYRRGGSVEAENDNDYDDYYARGGAVIDLPFKGYAAGGTPNFGDPDLLFADYPDAGNIAPQGIPGMPLGYAPPGQTVPMPSPQRGMPPAMRPIDRVNQGFGSAEEAIAQGVMDPWGKNQGTKVVEGPQNPFMTPVSYKPSPDEEPTEESLGYSRGRRFAQGPSPTMTDATREDVPYPDATKKDAGSEYARSPWMALTAAGLGIMGGESPYAGINIGKGGLEGVKVLDQQRQRSREEENVNLAAKRLMQEAEFHSDQYNKMTPYQRAQTALESKKIEQDVWAPVPYSIDGSLYNKKTGEIRKPNLPGTQPPATSVPEVPLAKTTVAPTGGRLVSDEPESMVSTDNVAKGAKANPEVQAAYPNTIMRGRALTEANTEARDFSKQVQAADMNKQRAVEMRHSLDTIMNYIKDHPNDKMVVDLINPGILGDQRRNLLNTWASLPNNRAPQEVIAAVNKFSKDAILGGMTNITATGLSAREAQPIIRAGMSAIASYNLPEQSSRVLLAAMEASSDRVKDMKSFMDAYRAKNGGIALGWREAFDAQNPPEKYIARSLHSMLPPEARQSIGQHVNELRATRNQLTKAEESGNKDEADQLRKQFLVQKRGFDRLYNGLGNYFAFGKF